MKIEIITEEIIINPKEKELCGIIKEAKIFTKINEILTAFPYRYKIKDGKVTAL